MPVCPSCNTEVDPTANYCSNCGESIKEASLPGEADATTTLRIEFGWTRSKYYDEAVELAETADTHDVIGEGKDAEHTVELTHEDLQLAERLWDLVGGWKSSSLFIDGERVESSSIWHGGLRCFKQRQEAGNGEKYCFATSHRRFNLWGCRKIGLPLWHTSGWMSWGQWDKQGRWHFNMDRIRETIRETLDENQFCPALKARNLEEALERFPEVIDPANDPYWDYPVTPGPIENYQSLSSGPRPLQKKMVGEDGLPNSLSDYDGESTLASEESRSSNSSNKEAQNSKRATEDHVVDEAPTASRKTESTLQGHVHRIKDGDTLVVSLEDGRTVDVRLWGVDAPETDQPYGPTAIKAAKKLAKGKTCEVAVWNHGQHGRIIGRVFASEKSVDVGHSLVSSGYAWHRVKYVGGHDKYAGQLEMAQQEARYEELGLWGQSNPIPPWQWRDSDDPLSEAKDVYRDAKKTYGWMRWLLRLFS
jgi:endonuclease YncB( thermonuclease family)